ncbi:MAG: glycosyl transferase family 1, partial [Rhodospirillaceae bacterium]|nr:glycosyl transferase family 1 [Rhodospirillaceae bacterium]
MAVAVVTDAAALEALAPAWRDLWALCPEATAFQSPDWLVPWWRAFAPGTLATIAVWRGERLVGLAPFYGEPVPGGRLVPLGISLSDHLDVLLDPEHAEAAAVAIAGPCGAGAIRW